MEVSDDQIYRGDKTHNHLRYYNIYKPVYLAPEEQYPQKWDLMAMEIWITGMNCFSFVSTIWPFMTLLKASKLKESWDVNNNLDHFSVYMSSSYSYYTNDSILGLEEIV